MIQQTDCCIKFINRLFIAFYRSALIDYRLLIEKNVLIWTGNCEHPAKLMINSHNYYATLALRRLPLCSACLPPTFSQFSIRFRADLSFESLLNHFRSHFSSEMRNYPENDGNYFSWEEKNSSQSEPKRERERERTSWAVKWLQNQIIKSWEKIISCSLRKKV